ncbi:hypothetical protein ACHAPV_005604 [Trichoderma viride]
MPAKKDRKNAKHSGGIAAAVTKQTAGKFVRPVNDGDESGNDSSKSIPTSNASSPPINTPEIRPSAALDNENPEPSPSLDALSTTSVSASTAPSMIHDWARNRMAASPSNLIALASESPPTQPSSYEDPSHLHHGWSAQRAFMTPSPASPSPPTSHSKRPLSYQMDPQFVSPDSMPRASSVALHQRRSSVNSPAMYPHGHSRMGSHPPPLPHQPQAHFYGVSDLDLTIKPKSGMKPGDQGLYFGFDKLPSPYSATGSENVVLAGYQGGLEVYGVGKRGLEPMASLKGLRGGVHYAKILPWTVGGDKDGIFPLVALVVHGPVLPRRSPATPDEEEDDGTAKKTDGAASPRSAYTHHDAFSTRNGQKGQAIEAYQTTVEVYSLKTNKVVDVLLQAPTIPISTEVSITSPIFQPPLPTGAFAIKADAGTVAVCSGSTGECWVYTQLLQPQNGHLFACTAKLWTCIQPGQRGSDVPEESDKMNPLGATRRPNPPTAIFALNGRKIAYCPAAPSSSIAIRAHLPVPILGRGAGITSVTPPHLPSVTASVDLPISDSVVNKVMREATQELIQGAKWVGQQGLQAWNSYWNRATSPQSQQQQPWSPPQQWNGTRSPLNDGAAFPPTHGTSGQAAATKDSGLVSILDVDSLALSPSIHPSATFLTPLGCSFLSFSPSSLSLFTASSKGDVQTVWDLFRIQHTHSSPLQASMVTHDSTGPQVRQIAQFSRMTVARIIDVVWMEPQGERLAMVTERGTVHLLDMPFSAFMWPPPRRRKVTPKPAAEPSEPSSSAVSLASGAFGAAYQVAMPFVTRSRQGSGNSASTAGSILKDSAAQGGRAIAASITSSIGKTGSAISQLRHTGENRLSLPPSSSLPSSSCVVWIRGRRSATLFNLGGGLVRTYPYKSRRQSGGKRGSRVNRYTDHQVPLLPDDNVAPAVRQILDSGTQEEYLDLSDTEMDIGTTLTLKGRPHAVSNNTLHTMAETIPQAEIECSAPYQPFHTDRRVILCEYTPAYGSQLEGASEVLANSSLEAKAPSSKKSKNGQHLAVNAPSTSSADGSAWAFGQDISVVKLDLGLPSAFEDEYDDPEDHRPLPPSAMERVMEFGDSEQIVVTTRRRRGAHQGDPDGDGFFEDDCEVLDFADQRV